MPMTSTVTLAYEGPPSCRDCQREGIPSCAHIGFNPEAWGLAGTAVMLPGLDPAYDHTVREVEISADRNTVTLTVDTARPPLMDLARHLSVRAGPKAAVRAVHADSGVVLAEGAFDAPLQPGQPVWINGAPHEVVSVEHPDRGQHGAVVGDGPDVQVARLQPQPEPEPVQPLPPREVGL